MSSFQCPEKTGGRVEGVFSYDRDSDVFTLSPKAARDLRLSEVISAPAENEAFLRVFSPELLELLMSMADATTREKPDFTIRGIRGSSEGDRPVTFLCRAIWIDEEARCCGAMGRIMEG